MGILRRRASYQLGQPGTTRYILITTGVAQPVVMSTGAAVMYVFNQGTANLLYGSDTTVAIGSGAMIYAGVGHRFGDDFDDAQDDFTVYFTADTAQGSIISVVDYYI